jgi:predicted TIM-barrel enzyme
MVGAGADLFVCHVGLTTAGSIGAGHAYSVEDACGIVMELAETIWSLRQDALVICHGGPFDEPEQVQRALKLMPGIAGFYGASSAERLPTERAIQGQIAAFKQLALG